MHKIPNVLAERYATAPMKAIWSAEGKVVLEREFWIAVMKACGAGDDRGDAGGVEKNGEPDARDDVVAE